MLQQSQSQFRPRKVIAIGGRPSDRASLSYLAAGSPLAVEPLASVDELTEFDVANADAILLGDNFGLLDELRMRLASASNFAPVIGFSAQPTIQEVIDAFERGVQSFIEPPCTAERVLDTTQAAIERASFLGTYSQRARAASLKLSCLSAREREVLEALADGLSNKVIALRLSISPRTVEVHRANAFAKMGVSHSAEAIRLVLEANFHQTLCERTLKSA